MFDFYLSSPNIRLKLSYEDSQKSYRHSVKGPPQRSKAPFFLLHLRISSSTKSLSKV